MPIYEFECTACRSSFELLMRSDTKLTCPACESDRIVRKLSLFAAHTKRPEGTVPACHTGGCGCDMGKCGSGFCGAQ
jgi:putative FmdB family regulatory protein